MLNVQITPIYEFDGWWAKRDDMACQSSYWKSSGSKVRQYTKMVRAAGDKAALVVGCSADSAMQVYLAEAAVRFQRRGIIVVPARKERSPSTSYAGQLGVQIIEVRPGYLTNCRAKAREVIGVLPSVVKWSGDVAIRDIIEQCVNLPSSATRIVVASGSGQVAAGVAAGMAEIGLLTPIFVVAASPMAKRDAIVSQAANFTDKPLPPIDVVYTDGRYGSWEAAILPDGTYLDPYYAARALRFVKSGDCFWIPARRAWGAIPRKCQTEILNMLDKLRRSVTC